jgi:hypothetical protein
MSDEPNPDRLPEPDPVREPVVETLPAPVTAEQQRRPILPVLCLIGFVILAVAIGYVYERQQQMLTAAAPAMQDQSGAVAALRADLNALKTRVAGIDGQEKQDAAQWQAASATQAPAAPAPAPAPASAAVAPAVVDSGLAQQVAALSDRLDKIASSQSQQAQSAPSAQDVSALSTHLDSLTQRESQDSQAVRQDMSAVRQQVSAVTTQIQGLTKDTSDLPKLAAQSTRLGQILRAQEALRAGSPLGPIDGAPPALAKFETVSPPTEAALRLSFPAAAKTADAAGQPLPSEGKFWHRVWLRVQNLVVVRRGDQVLVGDPTGGVLAHAERLLDAGDLPGTLTVLATLSDPARSAMTPWMAQAKSLVDARQALAQMAAG